MNYVMIDQESFQSAAQISNTSVERQHTWFKDRGRMIKI